MEKVGSQSDKFSVLVSRAIDRIMLLVGTVAIVWLFILLLVAMMEK